MFRAIPTCCLLVLLAGCAKEEDYHEIVRQQRAARKEVKDILATIKDGPSMAAAKRTLDENVQKYEAIASKARAMPRPSPEIEQRLREDAYLMEGVMKGLQMEVKRVSDLPGGREFWKHFESTAPGLFSAVQP